MQGPLLYIGSGSFEAPCTGLDNVTVTHLEELSQGSREVAAILVSPTIAHYTLFERGNCRIHVYPNILRSGKSRLRVAWEKFRLACLSPHSIQSVSLYSPQASEHIKRLLKQGGYSAIVIDYIYSLTNIALRTLLSRKHKLVYICLDVVTAESFRTYMQYDRPRWRSMLLCLQLAKSRMIARMAVRRAELTVFLSEYDRRCWQKIARKSFALLPFRESALQRPAYSEAHDNTVLFIGSPDFPPNAFAAQWLIDRLSPCLMTLDPSMRIVLVGQGVERLIPAHVTNVEARGFVPEEEMQALLRRCVALVCPVIHGGGIKIKILDAIAQVCPVIATPESLRGYEFFQIPPEVFMDDPMRTARHILALATEPELRMASVRQLSRSLERYLSFRQGKLLEAVETIASQSA